MDFELLDGYLLDGVPAKGEVVRRLLENRPQAEVAAAARPDELSSGSQGMQLCLLLHGIVRNFQAR
jgi:hypothetical protein